jgi:hypothetical protein
MTGREKENTCYTTKTQYTNNYGYKFAWILPETYSKTIAQLCWRSCTVQFIATCSVINVEFTYNIKTKLKGSF